MYMSRSSICGCPAGHFLAHPMICTRKLLQWLLFLLPGTVLYAQESHFGDDIIYKVSASGQFGSGEHTPFWQSANRFGLASTSNNSAHLRVAIERVTETDSLCDWKYGYTADLVMPFGFESQFIVQQLNAELTYKNIQLSVGQKERPTEMKNDALSSGSMTLGINSRPMPQVRIETPKFFNISGRHHTVHMKAHIAYGWYTDNKWQRKFNAGTKSALYTANTLFHTKAGYIRIGNFEKFPLMLTGGLEMAAQFGGTVWNRGIHNQEDGSYHFGNGIKEYVQAFIPTGSDVTDGDNPNVMGNQLGSYQARLDYKGKGWAASLYGEHFFEDHSMLGWDFQWIDFLWGAEVQLPSNPFISTLLIEHMRTTDQSGPVFRTDGTNLQHGIGGMDGYYNHGIYGAYQHAGYVIGSPLILSPIYNENHRIETYDNRITAHHLGISGSPRHNVRYRLLLTYEKSLGTYQQPHQSPRKGVFILAEATYAPCRFKGLSFTGSFGQNYGNLIGSSTGGMLTITYQNTLRKKATTHEK